MTGFDPKATWRGQQPVVLNFLTCRKGLLELARVRRASLLKVPGIGAEVQSAKSQSI